MLLCYVQHLIILRSIDAQLQQTTRQARRTAFGRKAFLGYVRNRTFLGGRQNLIYLMSCGIQISLFLITVQHEISKRGWIPSSVNSYMFTLCVLALAVKFNSQGQNSHCSWTQSCPGSIPGSAGLIFEAADE